MVSAQDIRTILARHGTLGITLDRLSEDDDLFDNGLDSFGAVQVMMDLEEHFEVEFPEDLLNRDVFSTIRSLRDLVSSQVQRKAA
ncbi:MULTISPECIES: acyl carrier protein [Methylobacterium]|jgi:D-alanine--poly(phosphoribitol) ligase subunit 2|uniref:Acyl carrier protein n=2 Tax=Methylobacterium TaxID=407 RepID=A0A0C6FE60_9HYPH|nr:MULTISPECIES: acyl carrier protein [Methylobacterium]MBK3396421.1 acyl carrier protein [Methylobacterium ajmalii]MBK3407761.1 acyl carrier protein [Methylobacterium ajmalii]MBK3420874.1 acyl carrier protein [Methylobacterium ajmalii]MBZ6412477.1 acyl carrier protein [Methylobacterium sp.]SFE26646.1 Acyl carrier protein [Methylobacterium sp. yr596]